MLFEDISREISLRLECLYLAQKCVSPAQGENAKVLVANADIFYQYIMKDVLPNK